MKRLIYILVMIGLLSGECHAEFREISFGKYYKNSREMTSIKWLVLEENDDELVVIASECLDNLPYHERREDITWETCSLRKWLNGEFLNTAFNDDERPAIIGSVFLLSREEIIRYMPEESSRQCSPTSWAKRHGAYTNEKGLCAWWTRSHGQRDNQSAYLNSYGAFGNRPHYVDDKVIAVRPALRLNRRELIFTVKPDSLKAQEAETTRFPMIEHSPFDAKDLHEFFLSNPEKAMNDFDRRRFDVRGVVLRSGPDGVFGQPCIELSDTPGGKCYVLCIFQDSRSYESIKPGDSVTVRGNYLVTRRDYGIVLKVSELI